MNRFSLKSILLVIKNSVRELSNNDPLRLAAATAFFTTFALPPILIIIILVLGLVFNRRNIRQELFDRLEKILGVESVDQLLITLKGFRQLAQNWWLNIALLIFLVFVATTLFKIIKASINQIWCIRIEERSSIKYRLNARFHSFVVILLAGMLFLTALLADGAQAFLGKYINLLTPKLARFLGGAINQIFSVTIVTVWFSVLFRYLPDARPKWKVSFIGGLVTGVLFTIGKLVIGALLGRGNITSLYGASGSLVLILLFVFYSSFILYFGAAFTKVWANLVELPIKPLPHAVQYHTVKVDLQKPE